MLSWWKPEFGVEEAAALSAVVTSQFINEGPVARDFERRIGQLIGSPQVLSCTSGTAAMTLALKALGVGAGDEVIVSTLTFAATANAAHLIGAKVILCDIESESLGICPEDLSRKLTKKTKAVIATHVTGRACQIDKISNLTKEAKVSLIEDAAEALGSFYFGKHLGRFSDAAAFSFSPNKIISTGQGGALLLRDPSVFEMAKSFKNQGRRGASTGGDDLHSEVGFNFKFTDLQAAVGCAQLDRFSARAEKMKQRDLLYRKLLSDCAQIKFFNFHDGQLPLWTDVSAENRDQLVHFLAQENIQCRKFWIPLHRHPSYNLSDQYFPVASEFSSKLLWLPSAFQLVEADVELISARIKEFYATHH